MSTHADVTRRLGVNNLIGDNADKILKHESTQPITNSIGYLCLQSGSIAKTIEHIPNPMPFCEAAEADANRLKAAKSQSGTAIANQVIKLKEEAKKINEKKDQVKNNFDLENELRRKDSLGLLEITLQAIDGGKDLIALRGSQTVTNTIKKHVEQHKVIANDANVVSTGAKKTIKKIEVQRTLINTELGLPKAPTIEGGMRPEAGGGGG